MHPIDVCTGHRTISLLFVMPEWEERCLEVLAAIWDPGGEHHGGKSTSKGGPRGGGQTSELPAQAPAPHIRTAVVMLLFFCCCWWSPLRVANSRTAVFFCICFFFLLQTKPCFPQALFSVFIAVVSAVCPVLAFAAPTFLPDCVPHIYQAGLEVAKPNQRTKVEFFFKFFLKMINNVSTFSG